MGLYICKNCGSQIFDGSQGLCEDCALSASIGNPLSFDDSISSQIGSGCEHKESLEGTPIDFSDEQQHGDQYYRY